MTSCQTPQRVYLPLVFLLVLLGEHRVHPPDLCKHAAISQTEAESQQPQAELEKESSFQYSFFIYSCLIHLFVFFSQRLYILQPSLPCYYFPWCLRVYLAHYGKLRATDVKPVDPERKDGSQRHHAAHSRHVVQVRLWVLNVPGTYGNIHKRFSAI